MSDEPLHSMDEPYARDTMERHAVIAGAAYEPNKRKRQAEIDSFYRGEYELLPEFTDKHHTTVRHKPSGNVIVGIRGTDFGNRQGGRIDDLATDVLVTFGLEGLSKRYKRSDRMVERVAKSFPGKVSLAAHSLGGTLAQELGYKYDLPSHSFAAGATPFSNRVKSHKALHPGTKKKRAKTHSYIVMPSFKGTFIDPISFSNAMSPFLNTHWIRPKQLSKEDEGVLFHHSIEQFKPTKAVM